MRTEFLDQSAEKAFRRRLSTARLGEHTRCHLEIDVGKACEVEQTYGGVVWRSFVEDGPRCVIEDDPHPREAFDHSHHLRNRLSRHLQTNRQVKLDGAFPGRMGFRIIERRLL